MRFGETLKRGFLLSFLCVGLARAAPGDVVMSEQFSTLSLPTGWVVQNNSSPPGQATWQQGPIAVSPPNGTDLRFAAVNFESASIVDSPATADNWFLSPELTFHNGDQVTFQTRKATPYQDGVPNDDTYAERLQLWIVPTGTPGWVTTLAGPSPLLTQLIDINPTYDIDGYPIMWTSFPTTLTGLPSDVTARLGFRYFIADTSVAGNEIWLDNVQVTSGAVASPEPAGAFASVAFTAIWAGRRPRRRPSAPPR